MALPRIAITLLVVFLSDANFGAIAFALFRRIADQDPPGVSLHLGMIFAVGSGVYFIVCHLTPLLGPRLSGRKLPMLGNIVCLVVSALLLLNRQIWSLYLLWSGLMFSWALIFPSMTAYMRQGRSGRALRPALFLYCIAWMAGITFGSFYGSKLYGLAPGVLGAGYVYASSIGLCLLCLLLLALPTGRLDDLPKQLDPDDRQTVGPGISRAFLRMGWAGNVLIMICGVMLFSLFNKVATDLNFSPVAHGRLLVLYRLCGLAMAGLMMLSFFWHYRWGSFAVAQVLALAGLCVIGLTNDYWLFLLGFVLVGIMAGHNYYAGVYYSLTSVSSSDTSGQRGLAAVNESFFSVGSIVGAALGAIAAQYSLRLPYFLAAASALAIILIQAAILCKARDAQVSVEVQNLPPG